MPERRHMGRILGLVAIAAVLGSLALIAAPASANVSHTFKTTFGSATSTPPDPYPISEPTDVAEDQESGDIYVTDPPHHRVEKLDAEGHFLLMFGKEVNKTAVETSGRGSEAGVCPASGHPGDVCQSGTAAESPGAYEHPTYLAIDNYPFGEGDIYVGDTGDNHVTKLDSSGHVITGWGVGGQKDGSDDPRLPKFGPIFGLAVGGGCQTPSAPKVGTCHANGTLYVGGRRYGDNVRVYTQSGEFIGDSFGAPGWLKVNSAGRLFYINSPFGAFNEYGVYTSILKPGSPGEGNEFEITADWPASGFAFDSSAEELYAAVETRSAEGVEPHGIRIDHYSGDCEPIAGTCEPIDSFGEGLLTKGARKCAFPAATGTRSAAKSTSRASKSTVPATRCTWSTRVPPNRNRTTSRSSRTCARS